VHGGALEHTRKAWHHDEPEHGSKSLAWALPWIQLSVATIYISNNYIIKGEWMTAINIIIPAGVISVIVFAFIYFIMYLRKNY
jgi:hypothetical protein